MNFQESILGSSSFNLRLLEGRCLLFLAFNKEHNHMLGHTNSAVTIHPRFITPLRTAVENGKDLLDKDTTSYDAFRLSLLFWH